MLYLLCFFGLDLLYLFIGAMYMLIQMLKYDEDWDNSMFLLWPIFAWNAWRLNKWIAEMHSKWEDHLDGL